MRPSASARRETNSPVTSIGSMEPMRGSGKEARLPVQIGGSRQRAAAQVGQIRPAGVVRAQVDAGEHNLTDAGFSEGHRLGHHLVGRSARRAAAGHVHDAVGARVVAAVLHLDADARAAIGGRCWRAGVSPGERPPHFQLAEMASPAALGTTTTRSSIAAKISDDGSLAHPVTTTRAPPLVDRAWRTALRVFFSASPVTVQVFTMMRSAGRFCRQDTPRSPSAPPHRRPPRGSPCIPRLTTV